MYEELIENSKKDLESSIERLNDELGKLRIGRANPALVENLTVEYYGAKTPLKQVAAISVPEPRLIVINPWDKDSLVAIESAIKASDLGINPSNDGQVVRLSIPPLNEERRQDLVKVANQKTEEAKVAIRNVRESVWRQIQDLEKDGKISEDDKFKGKDKLQKLIDEYNSKVEEIRERKEKEIMTV